MHVCTSIYFPFFFFLLSSIVKYILYNIYLLSSFVLFCECVFFRALLLVCFSFGWLLRFIFPFQGSTVNDMIWYDVRHRGVDFDCMKYVSFFRFSFFFIIYIPFWLWIIKCAACAACMAEPFMKCVLFCIIFSLSPETINTFNRCCFSFSTRHINTASNTCHLPLPFVIIFSHVDKCSNMQNINIDLSSD